MCYGLDKKSKLHEHERPEVTGLSRVGGQEEGRALSLFRDSMSRWPGRRWSVCTQSCMAVRCGVQGDASGMLDKA
jgi:hypothetical protein